MVCAKNAHTAADGKVYSTQYYNLDVIISLGYRVKSKRGTQFRIWATQRLKDYLVQGYAINEKRLKEKQQEVEYLKTGIRILNRVIDEELNERNDTMLSLFAKGLELLDDYDHETLDQKGLSTTKTVYPEFNDYMEIINEMYSDFESDVFAKPKDDSFYSSINQIKQSKNNNDQSKQSEIDIRTHRSFPHILQKNSNNIYNCNIYKRAFRNLKRTLQPLLKHLKRKNHIKCSTHTFKTLTGVHAKHRSHP